MMAPPFSSCGVESRYKGAYRTPRAFPLLNPVQQLAAWLYSPPRGGPVVAGLQGMRAGAAVLNHLQRLTRCTTGSGGAERNVNSSWNPLGLDTKNDGGAPEQAEEAASARLLAVSGGLAFVSALVMASDPAIAASGQKIDAFFDFNPVCPAADGAFRVGQRTAAFIAGDQNIENYRPLINDVLIRVRTEICVLESFLRETATPFIREKGIGWVLPLRETSETYLAGDHGVGMGLHQGEGEGEGPCRASAAAGLGRPPGGGAEASRVHPASPAAPGISSRVVR